MKKIFTSLMMAAVLGGWAGEPEVFFDLTKQDSFSKCTQTSIKYDRDDVDAWKWDTRGYPSMYSNDIKLGYYDDYLITPVLELEAGNQYSVVFTPSCPYYQYMDAEGRIDTFANVKVWMGQGDDVTKYEELGVALNAQYSPSESDNYEFKFIVETSGQYKIAFEGYSYYINLQKAKILKYGVSTEPKTPEDFTLQPDPDGGKSVKVSFTMPSTTATGQALANPTYTLYRGLEKVDEHTNVSAKPGEKVEFTVTVAETGKNIFYLQIADGENLSERLGAETYVGLETATPPTDVDFTLADGKFVVSWTAPAVGTHGAPLQPEKLTYSLSRFVDGVEQWISDDITGTSYTDTYESTGLHKLKYAVAAKYGTAKKFTTYTESGEKAVGTVNMPYGDSFADASMNSTWTNEVVYPANGTHATNYWRVADEIKNISYFNFPTGERYTGDILAVDEDGGFAYFDNTSQRYAARLTTPPIAYHIGEVPVLKFSHFENRTHSRDTLKVQIRINKGEWVDVENGQFINGGHDAEAWVNEVLPLSKYITEGATEFEVSFLAARGQTYAQYIALDAVKILSEVDKDLAVDVFSVSEKAQAGKTIDFIIKVTNNGKDEVTAEDYSVVINHNFNGEIKVDDLEAIPSNGSVTYEVSVPVSSIQLFNVSELTFSAKVVYTGDETPANNVSETKTIAPAYSEGNGTEILGATTDEDGNVTIKWEPATDLIRTPVNVRESFEGFAEDSWGPFNGWTVIDIDGKAGQTCYSASGSQFNVTEKRNNSTPADRDGENVLGVTVPGNVQQNDWIVSPLLNTVPECQMKLDFLFGMKDPLNYSTSPEYTIEVLYCTEETFDVLNPIKSFTHSVEVLKFPREGKVSHNNKMHRVGITDMIPGEAKYVALHFITKHTYDYGMWVDDIHIYEEDNNPLLGYNVYSLASGDKLNEDLLAPTATEFTFKPVVLEEGEHKAVANFTAEPCVFVASVYPDGEAAPKNVWNYVENSASGEIVAPEPEMVVTTIESSDWANIEVYTGAGKTEPVAVAGQTTMVETEVDATIYIYAKADYFFSSISDTAEGTYTVPATAFEVTASAANTITLSLEKLVRDKNLTVFVESNAVSAVALKLTDAELSDLSAAQKVVAGYNTLKFAANDELTIGARVNAVEVYVDGVEVDATKPISDLTEATVVKIFSETPQSWTMNYKFADDVDVEVYHDHITKIESPATHSVFHGTHVAIKPVAVQATSRAEEAKLQVMINGTALAPNAEGFYEFTAEGNVEVAVAKESSGLESIMVEGQDVEIYNLQGIKVDSTSLTPGVYIIRTEGVGRKVMVE